MRGVAGSGRLALLAVGLIILLDATPGLAATTTPAAPRRVLLLHSFGRDFAPYDVFSREFRTALAQRSPGPVEFYDVSLDSARFDDGAQDTPFLNYVVALFESRPVDLVVPLGGPAVRFVQRNRRQLFASKPVLIAAVDQRHLSSIGVGDRDAVVAVDLQLDKIIENILAVRPDTTEVHVVLGNSPLERFWIAEARRAFEPYAKRVRIVWLNDVPFAEMLGRLAALPPHAAIFYGQLTVDADGVPHEEERALGQIYAVANAPIFGMHDFQLGRGIVGGPLLPTRPLAVESAAVAARILRGEPPRDISVPPRQLGTPAFDWRELRRWDIPESRLPAGSTVEFREPTFWAAYGWHVAGVAVICLAESMLIVVLLASRARRRRAERLCVESETWFRAILDTAAEAIITIDQRGRIESVNAATEKLFGYATAELVGRNVNMLMPPPFRAEHDGYIASYFATGQAKMIGIGREAIGLRKDGTTFAVELSVNETILADRRLFTGFVRDISSRRDSERMARDLSGRLIRAQEDERARLARELHDDVTQRLARLAIDVGRIERGSPGGATAPDALRGVQQGLARLSEDVHAVAYQLHPSILEDLGLGDAIETECEHFSRRESIHAEVKLRDLPRTLPRETAICLFRITQEALRNVVRHARAHAVQVSLAKIDRGLQLAVRDDGVGFDPAVHRKRPSLGLSSMLERTRLLGGELDIESAPGHGTTVIAWVPLNGESS